MFVFFWCLVFICLAPFCGTTLVAFMAFQTCHGFWAWLVLIPLALAVIYDKRNWQKNKKLAGSAIDASFDFVFSLILPEYRGGKKEEEEEENEVDDLALAGRREEAQPELRPVVEKLASNTPEKEPSKVLILSAGKMEISPAGNVAVGFAKNPPPPATARNDEAIDTGRP